MRSESRSIIELMSYSLFIHFFSSVNNVDNVINVLLIHAEN